MPPSAPDPAPSAAPAPPEAAHGRVLRNATWRVAAQVLGAPVLRRQRREHVPAPQAGTG